MANVYFKLKVMPESVEVNLADLKGKCRKVIEEYGAIISGEIQEEPIAFGLVAIIITGMIDESKGSLDPLEDRLKKLEEVTNAEVIDVRRGIG